MIPAFFRKTWTSGLREFFPLFLVWMKSEFALWTWFFRVFNSVIFQSLGVEKQIQSQLSLETRLCFAYLYTAQDWRFCMYPCCTTITIDHLNKNLKVHLHNITFLTKEYLATCEENLNNTTWRHRELELYRKKKVCKLIPPGGRFSVQFQFPLSRTQNM